MGAVGAAAAGPVVGLRDLVRQHCPGDFGLRSGGTHCYTAGTGALRPRLRRLPDVARVYEDLGSPEAHLQASHGAVGFRDRCASRAGPQPNHPHIRGTAQCEDIYFQAMERQNKFYLDCPGHVEEAFALVELIVGRKYELFEYVGSSSAKYVVVCIGSGCGSVGEYIDHTGDNDKGLIKIRLFRPWSVERFIAALSMQTLRGIAVCNKSKHNVAMGEPLFMDVAASLQKAGFKGPMLNGRFLLLQQGFRTGNGACSLPEF